MGRQSEWGLLVHVFRRMGTTASNRMVLSAAARVPGVTHSYHLLPESHVLTNSQTSSGGTSSRALHDCHGQETYETRRGRHQSGREYPLIARQRSITKASHIPMDRR